MLTARPTALNLVAGQASNLSWGRFPTCHDSQNTTGNPEFGESVVTEFDTTDPNLVKLITAWPTLPEPIRRAMLALIESTTSAHGGFPAG
jgi:hypothetical protein